VLASLLDREHYQHNPKTHPLALHGRMLDGSTELGYLQPARFGAHLAAPLRIGQPSVSRHSRPNRAESSRGSVGMVDGERIEGTTKGGRERVVSLDAGTVEALRAHRRRQLEDLRLAGESLVDTGHVFTTGFGQPIYPDTVSRLMAKTIKAYNEPADDEDAPEVPLPHARLHDLRHVHATLLLVAGVPVHVVGARGSVDHAPGVCPRDPSPRGRNR
jgi:hypothetical protein